MILFRLTVTESMLLVKPLICGSAPIAPPLTVMVLVRRAPTLVGLAGPLPAEWKRSQATGSAHGRPDRVPTVIPVVAPAVVVPMAIPTIVPMVMPIIVDLLDLYWWRYDLRARYAHWTC